MPNARSRKITPMDDLRDRDNLKVLDIKRVRKERHEAYMNKLKNVEAGNITEIAEDLGDAFGNVTIINNEGDIVNFISAPVPLYAYSIGFSKTNSTPEEIPGVSITVEADKVYSLYAVIMTDSDVAAGIEIGIDGTASLGQINVFTSLIDPALSTNQSIDTFPSTLIDETAITNALFYINGIIAVSVSGTIFLTFCQNVTNVVASRVIRGSFIRVEEMQGFS